MQCVVFYEGWQMECCGTAFSVGDAIKWPVAKGVRLNTPVQVGTIDYCYEAHDSSWQKLFVLEGGVENIKILYQRYAAASEDSRLMAPVCGEIVEVNSAKGFEKFNGRRLALLTHREFAVLIYLAQHPKPVLQRGISRSAFPV